MTQSDLTTCLEPADQPAARDPAEFVQRLESLREENEALGYELLRCYEQLNVVFEITEKIAKLQDPEAIQQLLLQRLGAVIGAGALYLDRGDQCVPIEVTGAVGGRTRLEPFQVRVCLAKEIDQVRETQRTLVLKSKQDLDGAHVMLVPLQQENEHSAVILVLRDRDQPRFDSGDMLASESVLGYGGQVLSNVLMVRHLQEMAFETVRALANAIDAKDNYTCGHSERVGWLARQAAAAVGLSEAEQELLEWAGILHDVGKIGVSERILNKPGKLTPEEFEQIKRHPRMSYEVLKPVAQLGPALSAVLYHHENWDGSGYPQGLQGEQIPLSARIIRIADTFDALTSTRAYRQGFDADRVFKILEEETGRSTDPHITPAFVELIRRYVREHCQAFEQRFPHLMNAVLGGPGSAADRHTPPVSPPSRQAAAGERRLP